MRLLSTRSTAGAALTLVLSLLSCSDAKLLDPPASDPRLSTSPTTPAVVISQVYGGGGNTGATLRNDFIELFNPGTQPVSLTGWSVQYASSTGTTWQTTALAGTIQPGGYYLVQQAAGAGGTTSLPTPDATGSIAMSASAGKVALVSGTAALSGSCPSGMVDLVGFGGAANCFRGSGPTGTLSNTTAALRKNGGCHHSADNAADFEVAAPSPRNSASSTRSCATTPSPEPARVTVSPATAAVGVGATQAFTAKALDAQNQEISNVTFTWSSSNTAAATVSSSGVVTGIAAGSATITATTPSGVSGSAALTVEVTPPPAADARVTEFHYDNEGTDAGEAIELEGDQGTSLLGWQLVLYSGSTGSSTAGQPYATLSLSGTFANSCGNGRGVLVFSATGLQNGDKDGFALVNPAGQVVEFLSYEGAFTATTGVAAGMTSTDVGVKQDPAPPSGFTLQRAGDGVWFGPYGQTLGACNRPTPPPAPTGIILEGYSFRGSNPLPVGFGEMYRVKDVGTTSYVPSGVDFSTSDRSIAIVDPHGNVTAVGVGTVTISALEVATGRAAATELTTAVFAWSDTSVYADELQFGTPRDANSNDDVLVNRPTFAASWNPGLGQPNWVAYNLEATHRASGARRCDCFIHDPQLPRDLPAVTTADYAGSNYSRGHMTMSADRNRGTLDNATTYYFSNIIPQTSQNNAGAWLALEQYLGSLAVDQNKEIFVFAGGARHSGTLNNAGRVAIPTRTWKIALVLDRDKGISDVRARTDLQIIAVDMPNSTSMPSARWEDYRVTVDHIEALTGYDFLAALPDPIEIAVESNTQPPTAVAGGPYAGSEGSPVSLSGAASRDPDGHNLAFAWSFGDGGTASGAEVSHTYPQDGSFTVRLIVTDPLGLADTATTNVSVANVAPVVAPFAGATLLPGESYTAHGTFTDPGADRWAGTVNYGDGSGTHPLTLSGKSFALSHVYAAAGSFTVAVRVSDDDAAGSQTTTVLVKTHRQAIQDLDGMVRGLVAAGRLQAGPGTSLRAKLNAAEIQLQQGGATAAVNQLRAFINEVEGLRDGGQLSASDATTLIDAANRVIRSLTR